MFKLKPSCKDYIWGGHRLVEEFGKEYNGEVLAETWELSCHPDGPSVIENGVWAGKTLQGYIEEAGREVLGTNCRRFREFPILIKLIDAKDNLSIQVHPNNRYALQHEQQYGKTEMWYIVDAKEGSFLYYGFKEEISEEEFRERIENNTLLEVLNAVPVKKGDVLFIEAGTIHAIGKDILIAEIQQNSNVTYRVYDYGRVGKDGKQRELHVDQAIAVTNRTPAKENTKAYPHIAKCDYFTVDKLSLDGTITKAVSGTVSGASFVSILFLDGTGTIENNGEKLGYKKGDSFFLPAGSGAYRIMGQCDALITTVGEKKELVRVGIDIGGTSTKIGLVDSENKLLATGKVATDYTKSPRELIGEIAAGVLKLLDENSMVIEQCSGVGIGVPGTVNRKKGEVLYSNNLKWENINLVEEMSRYLPIPISIANDADCATLGEVTVGAGKGYENMVMLTLGTGVGGGIIINGKLFTGSLQGGSELGHIVIKEKGRVCTCGRRGCLEAYASATAMRQFAAEVYGKPMEPLDLFNAARKNDKEAKKIVEQYIEDLGTGIVNIVNIFRPEIVLLGGGIAAQGEVLLKPIREKMQKECFGGLHGELPEIRIALLGNEAGILGAASLV